jgi:hypothetical protein
LIAVLTSPITHSDLLHPLMRTLWWHWAHLDNPGHIPHLKIPNNDIFKALGHGDNSDMVQELGCGHLWEPLLRLHGGTFAHCSLKSCLFSIVTFEQ